MSSWIKCDACGRVTEGNVADPALHLQGLVVIHAASTGTDWCQEIHCCSITCSLVALQLLQLGQPASSERDGVDGTPDDGTPDDGGTPSEGPPSRW
jgi:hypothetical protein